LARVVVGEKFIVEREIGRVASEVSYQLRTLYKSWRTLSGEMYLTCGEMELVLASYSREKSLSRELEAIWYHLLYSC